MIRGSVVIRILLNYVGQFVLLNSYIFPDENATAHWSPTSSLTESEAGVRNSLTVVTKKPHKFLYRFSDYIIHLTWQHCIIIHFVAVMTTLKFVSVAFLSKE